MLHHPFRLFEPHHDGIDTMLLTKEDHIHTDADITEQLGTTDIASLWQVHGNRTIVVHEPTGRREKADGLITDQPEMLLTIRAADCQPILVYAPERQVVGLLHVGWRGLLPSPPQGGGVGDGGQQTAIQSFFAVLQREWNIHPRETLVGIGPSLRQCCAAYSEPDHPLRQCPTQFWQGNHVDLAGIADTQLSALGIPPGRIERHPDCTACHPERYWTYRGGDREKVLQGYTNVLGVTLSSSPNGRGLR